MMEAASAGDDQSNGEAPGVWRPRAVRSELAGLKIYRTGWTLSRSAILIVSDRDACGSGDEARRMWKLADKFAAVGYHAVVLDFCHRDPFVPRQAWRSFTSWLNDHNLDDAFERAKLVSISLLEKNISRVVAMGFSRGAKVVVKLAKSDQFIKAAVLLETSSVTLEDIKGVQIPIFIAAMRHSDSRVVQHMGQFKDFLSRKYSVHSHVELYPKLEDAKRSSEMERLDGDSLDDKGPVKCAVLAYKDLLRWIDWIIVLSLTDSIRMG